MIEQEESFLDAMNINQMVIDAEITSIGEHLFQEWTDSNLDEGIFYADYQFALMCDSKEIKQAFNQFYDLKEDDEYYVGI
jgi:hypothetical protein